MSATRDQHPASGLHSRPEAMTSDPRLAIAVASRAALQDADPTWSPTVHSRARRGGKTNALKYALRRPR